ncbi:MAG: hypothetical protein IBX55_15635 [Methyloprofundus sp.]|uniref:hypothetical protein n=1 Tax=Thiomicrospira sp. TaxID=935 RepID=UPI0019E578C6|nr:hypothetical protein [Methyloprofundus sp.]
MNALPTSTKHDKKLQRYYLVEIELDGEISLKRCDAYRTEDGRADHQAIRDYFSKLGYQVGRILSVR